MKTFFIADLHLSESNAKITQKFLSFIATLEKNAAATKSLYILGDLFEVWIGDDDTSAFNQQIIQALNALTQKNITVCFLPGNRDFLIGNKFAMQTGCQLLKDPTKIKLHHKNILLTHGDLLCTHDICYQIFRKFIRCPFIKKIAYALPLTIRRNIAARLRARSQQRQKNRLCNQCKQTSEHTIKKMIRHTQADYLIYGHFHEADIYSININNKTTTSIALNDWDSEKDYILSFDENATTILTSLTDLF